MVFNNIKSVPFWNRYLFIRYPFITVPYIKVPYITDTSSQRYFNTHSFNRKKPKVEHHFYTYYTTLFYTTFHCLKSVSAILLKISPEVPVDDRRWSEFRKTYTVKNHKKWVISTRILSIKLLFNNLSVQQTQFSFIFRMIF